MYNMECDYLFKVIVVGDSGVGKTALIRRYAQDVFKEEHVSTIGVDFTFKNLKIDGKNVKLQLWDTAGQERFRAMNTSYYHGAHCIILLFDVGNRESFEHIMPWLDEIEKHSSKNACIYLGGNKIDTERTVSLEDAIEFTQERNLPYFELSAKENLNIGNLFEKLVQDARRKVAGNEEQTLELKEVQESKCCF